MPSQPLPRDLILPPPKVCRYCENYQENGLPIKFESPPKLQAFTFGQVKPPFPRFYFFTPQGDPVPSCNRYNFPFVGLDPNACACSLFPRYCKEVELRIGMMQLKKRNSAEAKKKRIFQQEKAAKKAPSLQNKRNLASQLGELETQDRDNREEE